MRKILIILLFIPLLLSAQFAGGSGTSGDPYQIASAVQLDSVRNHLASNYILTANINLTSYSNWVPIGDNSIYFTGNFNGNYKTISNFTMTSSSKTTCGLFGYISSDTIKNLTIKNANINLTSAAYQFYVGTLAGRASGIGLIQNVKISHPNITLSGSSYSYIGGLFGEGQELVRLCSVDTVNISTSTGSPAVGGLIGNYGSGGGAGIYQSYVTGSITVTNSAYTGGFIGNKGIGILKNCYSRVSCIIVNQYFYVGLGGFAMNLANDSTKDSYSAGISVLSPGRRNGFVDYNSSYLLTTCYFDSTILGTSADNLEGGSGGGATPRTTTQMKTQSTFTGWDFVNIWAIKSNVNDGYPYLINNPPYIPVTVSKRLRIRK